MIVFIGDVHGEFKELAAKLSRSEILRSSLIQVGDFGVGFKNKVLEANELEILNNCLMTGENHLYVIRGNHDNPEYFEASSGFSNIRFLPDFTLLDVEGRTRLLAGGAISIDRTLRLPGVSYWPGEGFVFNEALVDRKLNGITKIDIVVTHNSPEQFHPTELAEIVIAYSLRDKSLLAELKHERLAHSRLMNFLIQKGLKPLNWYYGHFHESFSGKYQGIRYRVLGCSEFFEHDADRLLTRIFELSQREILSAAEN